MDSPRCYDGLAVLGAGVWLLVLVAESLEWLALAEPPTASLGVALAVLVVVPLVARFADLPYRDGGRSRWYVLANWLQFPAALAAVGSLALPTGTTAALLAVPWLGLTLALAAFGLQRTLPNTTLTPALAIGLALLYLPVAGGALVAARAGVTFGFGARSMLLTVVHYHFAGCALPAIAGLLGREVGRSRRYTALVLPLLAGPAIVGLGIATSPAVELLAAGLLALLVLGLAGYILHALAPPRSLGAGLVVLAAFAVVASMGILVAFLASQLTSLDLAGSDAMLAGHGWLNAVGFALAGLVGFRLLDSAPIAPPLGMPISRLTARGRVGRDYLARNDLTADGTAAGMVDTFSAFDGPDCDAASIDPAIRAFYEETGAYDLEIDQHWQPGFRLASRLYVPLAGRFEQMNFRADADATASLSSRILPVADGADGRENVRAWVRTYADRDEAIYVAVYATHRLGDRPYMNIAFPIPFANLTSVLSVAPLRVADPDGVALSTRQDPEAGIYLRTPIGPLRLPLDETIRVWSPGMPVPADVEDGETDADLLASHDMYLFGRRFLRLDYRIERRPGEDPDSV